MPDKDKKSPWMDKKQQTHPADLPEEVLEDRIKSDDAKLERHATAAQLLETVVPPANEWRACWSCGKRVPLRFRDPSTGILMCLECLSKSVQHAFYQQLVDLLESTTGILPGYDDDDDDDVPDELEGQLEAADAIQSAVAGAIEEDTALEGDDIGGEEDDAEDPDAPQVPQANSPEPDQADKEPDKTEKPAKKKDKPKK